MGMWTAKLEELAKIHCTQIFCKSHANYATPGTLFIFNSF